MAPQVDDIGKTTYRYERKFLVDELDEYQVAAMLKLHPAMFREPYPPRWINNMYLDSFDLDNYLENIYGVCKRRKVRLRWYDELWGEIKDPFLEFKLKEGEVGIKKRYELGDFTLRPQFSRNDFVSLCERSQLPAEVAQYLKTLQPVLVNQYYRRYFVSIDGRFRLTIDARMRFFTIRLLTNNFLHKHHDHQKLVVELKYDVEHERDAARVAGFFPFRVMRNSKYVNGIEYVYY